MRLDRSERDAELTRGIFVIATSRDHKDLVLMARKGEGQQYRQ